MIAERFFSSDISFPSIVTCQARDTESENVHEANNNDHDNNDSNNLVGFASLSPVIWELRSPFFNDSFDMNGTMRGFLFSFENSI